MKKTWISSKMRDIAQAEKSITEDVLMISKENSLVLTKNVINTMALRAPSIFI
jgi:hypothetical protein